MASDDGIQDHEGAAFSLRLKERFDIEGPDGPEPQCDTLLFDVQLPLVPAEKGRVP